MLRVVCAKCFICIISFSSLKCLVRYTLSPFLEVKKLIINHSCDKWSMIYCSLGFCGACLVIYNKMAQASKVLILSAEMEQIVAELNLLQVLMVETQFRKMKGLRQGTKIMGLKESQNFQPCFSCITVPSIVIL